MVCLSVCLSVTIVRPAKMAELIEMPFGMWTGSGGPKELCTRLGPDPPREEAILKGKMAIVKYRDPQPRAVQKWLYRSGCILGC